jgi:hypothetical protein
MKDRVDDAAYRNETDQTPFPPGIYLRVSHCTDTPIYIFPLSSSFICYNKQQKHQRNFSDEGNSPTMDMEEEGQIKS